MTKLRGSSSGALFYQLERLFGQGTSLGSTEGELLERFVTGRDEAAFEALVARHGPMVLGVCRQLLRDPNDVDDAFQATFLVLVRKAGTLRRCDLLGNWLYGVAYRVAARARATSARRMARIASGHDAADSLADAACGQDVGMNETTLLEQSPWLHLEVSHLPEKYRIPIVLCYFEGLTHDEAASRLGWPLGTVKGRLARARDLLRRRLTRRGVTLSAAALASHLAVSRARAAVPASLQLTTLKTAQTLACHAAASLATTATVSIPVSALVQGVLQTMFATQVKTLALTSLLAAGAVATGVVVGATQLSAGPGDGTPAVEVQPSPTATAQRSAGRSGKQAAPPASRDASRSVSSRVVPQLGAARDSFSTLLSTFHDPDIEDIDRLSRWSSLTLQADLVLGTTEADRVAAYEAHRDRMKSLHELTQKIPVSDKNQPVKADHARVTLQEAEHLLESAKHGQMPVMVGSMMSMMGGRAGPMGMMGGGMAGMHGGGRMKMMGEMLKKGSVPAPDAGESAPSLRAASAAPKREASAAATKDAAPAKESTDQPAQQKGVARSGAQNQAAGMVGGMGMGSGMLGIGGGMGGGMGGMGGMMGQLSPEAMNRQARLTIAASAAELAGRETNPKSKAILKKLEEPISMSFTNETPLEDVLKYIKAATTTQTYTGIPIYVDPKGLKEAEATLQSPIALDLDGVPLKTTLRLMLKQIGLAFCVRDGVLMISSVQGINEELREAQSELGATYPDQDGGTQ
jgi:RNA polymerase sigma factor (sigma-70 family)